MGADDCQWRDGTPCFVKVPCREEADTEYKYATLHHQKGILGYQVFKTRPSLSVAQDSKL